MSQPIKVLIVDDNPEDREAFRRYLNRYTGARFSFADATTVEDGLDACVRVRPHCVVLDFQLPDVTGFDLLRRLPGLVEELPAVVVLTGQGDETTAVEAMKLGAADYLSKHADLSWRLPTTVMNAIEKRRLERNVQEKQEELAQFASVAAHDLKAPLRNIRGYAASLREEAGDNLNGPGQETLQKIELHTEEMTQLIDDLLEYTRTGRSSKPMESTPLTDVVTQALTNLESTIDGAGAQVRITGELPDVMGDRTALVQLFQNLVANAVKFSPEDPRVTIGAESSSDGWHLWVDDNGVGIPEEHQAYVFAPFYRAHGRHEFPGTGIGLAHCRKIVSQHGGDIWVQSTPGCGTRIHFTLEEVSQPEPVPA